MTYMVIEHFGDGVAPEVYRRLREKGRMMPEGLRYVSSWISQDLGTCYQLMETENYDLFAFWLASWNDLMSCEIVPVRTSAEMVEQMSRAR